MSNNQTLIVVMKAKVWRMHFLDITNNANMSILARSHYYQEDQWNADRGKFHIDRPSISPEKHSSQSRLREHGSHHNKQDYYSNRKKYDNSSRIRDGWQKDTHRSHISDSFQNNAFSDGYINPSESLGICENDISSDSKYIKSDKFYNKESYWHCLGENCEDTTPAVACGSCSAMATEEQVHALKDKLRESIMIILESDDYTVDAADEAVDALSALKDLKCTTSLSPNLDNVTVPPHFRCPLSGNLMTDPVILASGKTFDRLFIQRWLNEIRRLFPETQQVLSHSILTPNCFLQNMISQWCKEHGVELPKPVWDIQGEQLTEDHILHLRSLLYKLSLSVSEQKEAAKELRQLTKRMPAFRKHFGESEVIQLMLRPLSPGTACVDPELHEDLIATLLNLSIHDNNKRVLAEDEKVISLLIESLKYSGKDETRCNAAAAIFSMSDLDANKHIIGKSGVIKYLVDLLEEGHPPAMRDAASALFKLCYTHENKGRTVREGAVQVILGKIVDHVLVDELLALLALLSAHPMAVEALVNHGAVPFLLDILREKENTSSESIKENCVIILRIISSNDREKRREIREDEMVNGTLSELAQRGNPRAQRKARAILERLHMVESSTS